MIENTNRCSRTSLPMVVFLERMHTYVRVAFQISERMVFGSFVWDIFSDAF
jgi:hypothetical protein